MCIQIDGKLYQVDGRFLICKDAETGQQYFKKSFDHPQYESLRSLSIREMHISPDKRGIILLLEPSDSEYKAAGNLVGVTVAGEVMWWAEPPDGGGDTYVSVGIDDKQIIAQSWDGFKCILNPDSGRIVSKKFTK